MQRGLGTRYGSSSELFALARAAGAGWGEGLAPPYGANTFTPPSGNVMWSCCSSPQHVD